MQATIPTVILGGTDPRPARLPRAARGVHPLSGYKGVDVHIGGRPLVAVVVERLSSSGRFGPVHIAGPSRVYAHVPTAAVLVDTDGTFGENIRAAMEAIAASHPGSPIAFTTCDILPDVTTLGELMSDYAERSPCDVWFPLIRAPHEPERLGASSWKPSYRIVPHEGAVAEAVLPGHLAIVDPAALRLDFLYRLFDLGYRTRNRPIGDRRRVMLRSLLLDMLYQDWLRVCERRPPLFTVSVLAAALPAVRALKDGTVTRVRLEDAVRRMFVRRAHRRRFPERRVALPIVDGLSLARDIDTEEEATELGGTYATAGPG